MGYILDDVNLSTSDTLGEQRIDRSQTAFGKMTGAVVNMGGNPVTNMALIITIGAISIFGGIIYFKLRKGK